MPTGVQLTSRSQAVAPSGHSPACAAAIDCHGVGALGVPGVNRHGRPGTRQRRHHGARRAAGAEHSRAQSRKHDAAVAQRPQKAGDVAVRPLPSAVFDAKCVDGADLPRQRIDLVHPLGQRDLVRDGDAGARDAHPAREGHEVVGIGRRQRQVHAVDAGRSERGVVHRRGDGVRRPEDRRSRRASWSGVIERNRTVHEQSLGRAGRCPARRRRRSRPNRTSRRRHARPRPRSPIAMSTTRPGASSWRAVSSSRTQSLSRVAIAATFTTPAPVARMARARSVRSSGKRSKSCDDRTIRGSVAGRSRSVKPARHSTST